MIIDLCIKELVELTTKDLSYKDVRDEILNFVERKRDTFGTQLQAMARIWSIGEAASGRTLMQTLTWKVLVRCCTSTKEAR